VIPINANFRVLFITGMNRGNTGMNINWVKKTFLSKDSNRKEIPHLKILKPRSTPDNLIQAVFDEFGCGMENILQKGKKGNLERFTVHETVTDKLLYCIDESTHALG
jgi:hypothetical protein